MAFIITKTNLLYIGLTLLIAGGILFVLSFFGTYPGFEIGIPISMSICILGISFLMKALIPVRVLKFMAIAGWGLALVYGIGFVLSYHGVFPESVFLIRLFMAGSLLVLLFLLANVMVWIKTPESKSLP